MATGVRHSHSTTEAGRTAVPAKGRRRRFRWARWVGIAGLLASAAILGNLAWQVFGTGIITGREQDRLRAEFAEARLHPGRAAREPLPGDAVAIIEIPRIGLDKVVVEGADADALTKGPGHYPGTAYPWQGHGRVAIAGHRTTYARPFWSLDRLEKGDLIVLETLQGTFRYRVTRSEEVLPSDVSVLEQTDRPTLVLTTCTPRFSAARRLVVFAVRS